MELHLEWYDSDGFSGSDGVDGCDGVVLPSGAGRPPTRLKNPWCTSLRTMTAARDSDGSRCLRHIAGSRAEGFSQKIGEDRAEELIALQN